MSKHEPDHTPIPRALTPKVHEAICTAIRHGMPIKHAAAAAHVGWSTLKEWLADAITAAPDTPQAALLAGVEQAKADLIDECLSNVLAAGRGTDINGKPDWKASAWVLERRFREDFSQHQEQHIKVSKEKGSPNFLIKPRRHTVPEVSVDVNGNGKAGTNGSANGEASRS